MEAKGNSDVNSYELQKKSKKPENYSYELNKKSKESDTTSYELQKKSKHEFLRYRFYQPNDVSC